MKPIFAFLASWLFLATPLHAADAVSIAVTETSLAAVNDTTEVDYNVVSFAVPALPEGRALTQAFLEFSLDVSSTLSGTLSGGVATVEIIVIPELVNGKLSVSNETLITSRVVKVGENRLVRVYITEILLQAMADNESDLALLVGPITGGRRGRFDANTVPNAPGGAKAVLTIQTQETYTDASVGGQ